MFYWRLWYIDWFTLSNKDKFAGKVYIELTFWSNVGVLSSIINGLITSWLIHLLKGASTGEKGLAETT